MVLKSVRILHNMLALSGWGDVGVRPQIFDRMLTLVSHSFSLLDPIATQLRANQVVSNDEQLPHAANALNLLYVSVEGKLQEWFLEKLQSPKGW